MDQVLLHTSHVIMAQRETRIHFHVDKLYTRILSTKTKMHYDLAARAPRALFIGRRFPGEYMIYQ